MDPKITLLGNESTVRENGSYPEQVFLYYRDPTFDLVFSILHALAFSYFILYSKHLTKVAVNVVGYLILLGVVTYILFESFDFWIGRTLIITVIMAVGLFLFRFVWDRVGRFFREV